jgi:hypothetical protein
MTIPGWDSLESVKRIVSALEVTTLVFWVLLVLFEIVARLWKKFARLFDVLALIAFAVAVSGEVVGHEYSHRKEALYDARELALTDSFSQKLQKANEDAQKARDNVQQSHDDAQRANQDAQHAAASSALAEQRAADAQSQLEDLKRQQAPRTLTEKQKNLLFSLLKPEGPQELYFVSAPDPESQGYADEISSVLNSAGWKTSVHPYNWGTIERYPEGVEILLSDVKKPAPRGAAVLQGALKTIGVEANGVSFGMVGEGQFALFIGLKPKPTR